MTATIHPIGERIVFFIAHPTLGYHVGDEVGEWTADLAEATQYLSFPAAQAAINDLKLTDCHVGSRTVEVY